MGDRETGGSDPGIPGTRDHPGRSSDSARPLYDRGILHVLRTTPKGSPESEGDPRR